MLTVRVIPAKTQRWQFVGMRIKALGETTIRSPWREFAQAFPDPCQISLRVQQGLEPLFASRAALHGQQVSESLLQFAHQLRLATTVIRIVAAAVRVLRYQFVDLSGLSCA